MQNSRSKLIKRLGAAFVLVSFLFLTSLMPLRAEAADKNVKLAVSVVKKKPTDTINDFDFSTVNVVYY